MLSCKFQDNEPVKMTSRMQPEINNTNAEPIRFYPKAVRSVSKAPKTSGRRAPKKTQRITVLKPIFETYFDCDSDDNSDSDSESDASSESFDYAPIITDDKMQEFICFQYILAIKKCHRDFGEKRSHF